MRTPDYVVKGHAEKIRAAMACCAAFRAEFHDHMRGKLWQTDFEEVIPEYNAINKSLDTILIRLAQQLNKVTGNMPSDP